MKTREHHFIVGGRNHKHPASLELRKLYETIPDQQASRLHLVRIIDESGEDYLYPEDYFLAVKLPQNVGRALLRAAQSRLCQACRDLSSRVFLMPASIEIKAILTDTGAFSNTARLSDSVPRSSIRKTFRLDPVSK